MIEWNDVVDLLKLCAVYDQRTVGEEDIKGWLLVAQHARWTTPAATRVIVEHYASGADRPRINPAQVSDGIRRARRLAAATFEAPVIPIDREIDNYPAWYRRQLREHVDRVIAGWAAGRDIPVMTPVERGEIQPTPTQRRAIESFAAHTRIPGDAT